MHFTCRRTRFFSSKALWDYPMFPWSKARPRPLRPAGGRTGNLLLPPRSHVALSSFFLPSPSIAKTILFQNNSGIGGCEEEEGRKLLSNKCEARVEGRHHLRDAEHEPDFRHGQRNGSTKSKILNLYLKHQNNIDVAIFLGYLWHGCQQGNQKVLLFPLHFIKSELSLAGKMRRPPPLPRRPPRRSLFHCSNMCCPPRRRCRSRSGGRARERCVVC